MLKLLGSTLILGAGVWLRWNTLTQRRRMRRVLEECLAALRRMAEEIRMARTALLLLLERLAGQCGPDAAVLFSGAAAALRRGEPLTPVWRTLSEKLPLPLESREVLADLGADLHGDEEAVCKAISLAVQRLEQHREDLENSRQAEEKRVTALCFSGAALLVILLI